MITFKGADVKVIIPQITIEMLWVCEKRKVPE